MKELWHGVLIVLTILTGVVAHAESLVCDPQAGAKSYAMTGPAWVPKVVPAQADGSLKMDLYAAAEGLNWIRVKACADEAGTACSPETSVVLGVKFGSFMHDATTVIYREYYVPGR